jgi:hypothetical protein
LATILKTFSLLNKNTNLSASDKKLKYRRAYAKFRCEVAPLSVETGIYERKAVHERTCLKYKFICI